VEERSSPRKLAAILIADAVGFSRQMGEDEERALRTFAARREAIAAAVQRHHGRVFGGAGDSVVAEFRSAVDAVRAAKELQAGIAALNETCEEAQRMLFRVGINLGDVIVDKRNLFGDGVNVAERLQALAEPGGLCISGAVHEQVGDKLAIEFVDLGARQLKNIAHPVRAYRLGGPKPPPASPVRAWPRRRLWVAGAALVLACLMGALALFLKPWEYGSQLSAGASGPPVIAVLPLANLSGDPGQDYLGDGISQDMIAALGRFSNLAVLANNATFKFKGAAVDPDELRQKLGARYVVAGDVRRSAARIRVSVALTDTRDGLQLWSRRFESDMTDIFAMQDEITRDITGALAIKLTQIEQERSSAKQTDNLSAYDYFLRGRAAVAKGERADVLAAREMFEKALALDPRYAAALAALGHTYEYEASNGWTEFVADALGKAESLARQAIALSPELSDGHELLSFVYLSRGDYDRGLVECQRALAINPSDAGSYASLGQILMWSGDPEGAIAAVDKARVFDPTPQFDNAFVLGYAYFFTGRYQEAVSALEPFASGSDYAIYAALAVSYAGAGRAEDAHRAAVEVKRLSPFFDATLFVRQWRDEKSRHLIADAIAKAGLS
jgi:TolB-like protein/class 3 adenylate cyclase